MVSDKASFKINHDNKERGKARVDDSSLTVWSVSCTVHLQLFTNIDILES